MTWRATLWSLVTLTLCLGILHFAIGLEWIVVLAPMVVFSLTLLVVRIFGVIVMYWDREP